MGAIDLIPTLILLTKRQRGYLEKIKGEHGISMSGYLRELLRRDMLGIGSQNVSFAYAPALKGGPPRGGPSRGPHGSLQVALLSELKLVLANRRID